MFTLSILNLNRLEIETNRNFKKVFDGKILVNLVMNFQKRIFLSLHGRFCKKKFISYFICEKNITSILDLQYLINNY